MHRPPPRLLLLSGFAAPPLLMRPQLEALPDVIVPPWIDPLPGESLRAYARRFAGSLGPVRPEGRPLVIGGLSFGGVVALEMAAVLRPARIVLMASCRLPRDVPLRLSLLRPIPHLLSDRDIRGFAPALAPTYAWLEGMTPPQAATFRAVAATAHLPILRWGLGALARWRRSTPPAVDAPIAEIHGDRDPLIPLRRAKPDETVRGGHHLINLTHAPQVNAFLQRQLALASG